MRGIVYGIGVGPGDAELMTLKAVRIIRNSSVIAVIDRGQSESTAYNIAVQAVPEITMKQLLRLKTPMQMEKDELRQFHIEGAAQIEKKLDAGEDVAILTLGDPSLYSTFGYLRQVLESDGYETRTVPGVNAYSATAAVLGITLAEWDEPLHIIPARHLTGSFMPEDGTYVLMKPPKDMETLKSRLCSGGWSAYAVVNCGMEEERIYKNLDDLPDNPGYFTTIIITQRH